ncbi:Heat shock cognate 70 kDa protein [Zostera marina]|uniref:Heat shock cognate 70 kDa protein n=1 Tax=Zostera marina TaxID=29655 RepID=A0A0K9Q6H8_ZOSMR|nr:Heat shock cognate 70 kDa protein [Zostera marina]
MFLSLILEVGTFDVSVIHIKGGNMEVKATSGDTFLGGKDFDDQMVSHFVEDIKKKKKIDISCDLKALRRLRSACEKAKRVISFSEETTIDLDYLYQAIDYQTSCMDIVKKCLAYAKLIKESVNEVIVVGGSTRIPKVVEILRDLFSGIELCKILNPDEAVAFVELWVFRSPETVVCIPTKMTTNMITVFDNQTEMRISVNEGERKLANDNYFLGEFILSGLPKALAGDFKIITTFELDADGILTVSAEHCDSGSKGKLKITNEEGRLRVEEIDRVIEKAKKYSIEDEKKARKAVSMSSLKATLFTFKYRVSTRIIKPKKKEIMQSAIQNIGKWFDENVDSADTLDFEKKKIHLENM